MNNINEITLQYLTNPIEMNRIYKDTSFNKIN